jgi:hypothetical protein
MLVGFLSLALFNGSSNAAVYIGSGVSRYNVKYKSEVLRSENNLTTANDTSIELNLNAPEGTEALKLFATKYENEIKACVDVNNGFIVSSPNVDGASCPGEKDLRILTKDDILIDIGMKMLQHTKVNLDSFDNKKIKEIALKTGSSIIGVFAKVEDLADANAVFNLFTNEDNKPLSAVGTGNVTIDVNQASQSELEKWDQIAQVFQTEILKTISSEKQVKYNSNKSQGGIGGFVSFGSLYKSKLHKDLYYGFDGYINVFNINLKNELIDKFDFKSNVSFDIMGKVGYSFFNNSLSYLSVGVGLQDYSINKKETNSQKGVMTNLIFGVGFEYAVSQFYNIFIEYLNGFNVSKISPKDDLVNDIKLKYQKINFGVRYYLGQNLIFDKKSKSENIANQNIANAFGKKLTLSDDTINFRDASKISKNPQIKRASNGY